LSSPDAWRWTDERGVQRLVSTAELREALASSVIPAATLVWRPGMKAWAPASSLPELTGVAQAGGDPAAGDAPATTGQGEEIVDEPSDTELEIVLQGPPAPPTARGSEAPMMRSLAGRTDGAARPTRSPPALITPAARRKRESMRTLKGIDAPGGDPPSRPLAPIIVPSAGGTFDAGVARAITQLPRYGEPFTNDNEAASIPRAPKLPSTEGHQVGAGEGARDRPRHPDLARGASTREERGATEPKRVQGAAPPRTDTPGTPGSWAPRAAAKSLPPPPRAVGRSNPPRAVPASAAPLENGRAATAATADKPSATRRPPPVPPSSSKGAGSPSRPWGRTVPPPPVPVRVPAIPPRKPPPPRAPQATSPSAAAEEKPAERAGEATPSAPPRALEAASPLALATAAPAAAPIAPAVAIDAVPPAVDMTPFAAPPTAQEALGRAVLPTSPPAARARPDAASAATPDAASAATREPTTAHADSGPKEVAKAPPYHAPLAAPAAARGPSGEDRGRATAAADVTPVLLDERSAAHASPAAGPPALPDAKPFALIAAAASRPGELAGNGASTASVEAPTLSSATAPRLEHARPSPLRRISALARAGGEWFTASVQVPVSSLLGAGSALIFMVVASFVVGRCSVGSVRTASLETARSALGAAQDVTRSAMPSPPKPCWVARQPRRWAPLVAKNIPFDVAATRSGTLMVGYARSATEAVGIEVNPATGEFNERFSQKEAAEIASITPGESGQLAVVTQKEGTTIRSLVSVPGKAPFVVGLAGGAVVSAERADAETTQLWSVPGDEPLEAPRALVAGAEGYAIAFRRERSVWLGWLGADRKPSSELKVVNGSGGSIGKPSMSWNGREVAVVFADRPTGSAPWEVRAGRAAAGKAPASTQVIPLPSGGPGGDAFAPAIAGLDEGRWLLVWTEGPAGSRAMRAQTLASDFMPVGDPIALSPPAGNFGQGIIGVSPKSGYVGVVFLSRPDASYELWGIVLQCG
jgi:GYF domain 2